MTYAYHVRTHSRYLGQAIVNSFYYELAFNLEPPYSDASGACDDLAGVFRTSIIDRADSPLVSTDWRTLAPINFEFERITVAPIADTFQWEFEAPFTYDLGIFGENPDTNLFLPPQCYFRANFGLENISAVDAAVPFTFPPKSAWEEFSPVHRLAVLPTGGLTPEARAAWNTFCGHIATNLVGLAEGAVFYPVRLTHRTFKTFPGEPAGPLNPILYSGYSRKRGVNSLALRNKLFPANGSRALEG